MFFCKVQKDFPRDFPPAPSGSHRGRRRFAWRIQMPRFRRRLVAETLILSVLAQFWGQGCLAARNAPLPVASEPASVLLSTCCPEQRQHAHRLSGMTMRLRGGARIGHSGNVPKQTQPSLSRTRASEGGAARVKRSSRRAGGSKERRGHESSEDDGWEAQGSDDTEDEDWQERRSDQGGEEDSAASDKRGSRKGSRGRRVAPGDSEEDDSFVVGDDEEVDEVSDDLLDDSEEGSFAESGFGEEDLRPAGGRGKREAGHGCEASDLLDDDAPLSESSGAESSTDESGDSTDSSDRRRRRRRHEARRAGKRRRITNEGAGAAEDERRSSGESDADADVLPEELSKAQQVMRMVGLSLPAAQEEALAHAFISGKGILRGTDARTDQFNSFLKACKGNAAFAGAVSSGVLSPMALLTMLPADMEAWQSSSAEATGASVPATLELADEASQAALASQAASARSAADDARASEENEAAGKTADRKGTSPAGQQDPGAAEADAQHARE